MTATATVTRAGGRRDFDLALSLVSVAGALFCTWLLVTDRSGAPPQSELPPVATLTLSREEVRRRPIGTLAWNELDVGAAVFELDSVFVPPGSGASLTFEDGSHLDIEENSLVVIERPTGPDAAQTQVQLVRGSASGVSGKGGMQLRTGDWVASLGADGAAKVDVQPGKPGHLEVFAGTAMVQTRTGNHPVDQQSAADISAEGVLVGARLPVALTYPPRGARRYFQGTPLRITLGWLPGSEQALAVQIAADRGFGELVVSAPAPDGSYDFQPRQAGTFWWRVVGSDGAARSELRRLEVIEDLPPLLTSPRVDEQVDTFGRMIVFAWSAVPNAPGYRLELSKEEDFSALVLFAPAATDGLTVHDALPEGPYHWRVRTVDPQRGESPFSRPQRFILIDKPLPDAPELIDSALEVTGGKKKR